MKKSLSTSLLLSALLAAGCSGDGAQGEPSVHSGAVVGRQRDLAVDVAGKLNAAKTFASDLDVATPEPKRKNVAPVVAAAQGQPGDQIDLDNELEPGVTNIVAFEASW